MRDPTLPSKVPADLASLSRDLFSWRLYSSTSLSRRKLTDRPIEWLERAVAYLNQTFNHFTATTEDVYFVRRVMQDMTSPADKHSYRAVDVSLILLRADVKRERGFHHSNKIKADLYDLVIVLDQIIDRVKELEGNGADFVEPVLSLIHAVLDAFDPPKRAKQIETVKIEHALALARAFLPKIALCDWLSTAVLTRVAPEFLERLREKFERKREDKSTTPYAIALEFLQLDIQRIRRERKLTPSEDNCWKDVSEYLHESEVGDADVEFRPRFIGPLFIVANDIDAALHTTDVNPRHINIKEVANSAKRLALTVRLKGDLLEAKSDPHPVEIQHTIGRRAARRYNINRNKFITGANESQL